MVNLAAVRFQQGRGSFCLGTGVVSPAIVSASADRSDEWYLLAQPHANSMTIHRTEKLATRGKRQLHFARSDSNVEKPSDIWISSTRVSRQSEV